MNQAAEIRTEKNPLFAFSAAEIRKNVISRLCASELRTHSFALYLRRGYIPGCLLCRADAAFST
jgi:hypothetical protein